MAEKLDLDALEVRNLGRVIRADDWMALLRYARRLEDDRDSWAEQASQRVADWQREHDLRMAAELLVSELERASKAGSADFFVREFEQWVKETGALPWGGSWMAEVSSIIERASQVGSGDAEDAARWRHVYDGRYIIGRWSDEDNRYVNIGGSYVARNAIDAARAAMGGQESNYDIGRRAYRQGLGISDAHGMTTDTSPQAIEDYCRGHSDERAAMGDKE